MKDRKCIAAILCIVLCFLIGGTSKAATLFLDLDRNTPGIQTTRTLNPGSALAFEVVFSGDGATQFDTFALDLLHTSPHPRSVSIALLPARSLMARRSWRWTSTAPMQ